MFMSASIWQIHPGTDSDAVGERAQRELMPLFKGQPGFISYHAMIDGDHLVVVHTWESRAHAEAPSGVDAWVEQATIGTLTLQQRYTGDVTHSTTK